jgi:hypothetical protein
MIPDVERAALQAHARKVEEYETAEKAFKAELDRRILSARGRVFKNTADEQARAEFDVIRADEKAWRESHPQPEPLSHPARLVKDINKQMGWGQKESIEQRVGRERFWMSQGWDEEQVACNVMHKVRRIISSLSQYAPSIHDDKRLVHDPSRSWIMALSFLCDWCYDAMRPARESTRDEAFPTAPLGLKPNEEAIWVALVEAGDRLTGEKLLHKALAKVNSNGRNLLSNLVKRTVLTNCGQCDPRGYGLPHWDCPHRG